MRSMLNPNEQKLTKKMNMCIVSRFFGPKEEIEQKKKLASIDRLIIYFP